jgi:hypothetical protein
LPFRFCLSLSVPQSLSCTCFVHLHKDEEHTWTFLDVAPKNESNNKKK